MLFSVQTNLLIVAKFARLNPSSAVYNVNKEKGMTHYLAKIAFSSPKLNVRSVRDGGIKEKN